MKWTLEDFRRPDEKSVRAEAPRQWQGKDDPFFFATCDPDIRSRRLFGEWPNWKSESDYQDINKRDLRRLGWEFLRRNPAYIADWHDLKKRHSAEAAGKIAGEEFRVASDDLCRRYGIGRKHLAPTPSLRGVPSMERDPESRAMLVRVREHGWIEDFNARDDRDFRDIRIFADGSIKDQLETVRKHLIALRASIGLPAWPKIDTRARDLSVCYLRILDAKAAWASSEEICAILYPRFDRKGISNRLSRNYTAAKRLATCGYRDFLWASILE